MSLDRWEGRTHIGLYQTTELRVVTFLDVENRRKATALFWHPSPLCGMPRHIVGGNSLAVPAEAIFLPEKEGVAFKCVARVHTTSDLSAEERAQYLTRRRLCPPNE